MIDYYFFNRQHTLRLQDRAKEDTYWNKQEERFHMMINR